MKGLILFVSLVQIAICLPQQDFNRDRDQHGSPQNPQDPFSNRNFLPQSFSGNANSTSFAGNPNRNVDRDGFNNGNRDGFNNGNRDGFNNGNRDGFNNGNRDGFNNGNFQTTESTSKSTSRYGNDQDTFRYENDRTEPPRGGERDRPFGVSPTYEDAQRTSTRNPLHDNPRPIGEHRPKGVNDKSYSSGASVNQSIAFTLIGFCYLLKFY